MKPTPARRQLSALDRHLGQRQPEEIRFALGRSSLGVVLVAASKVGIVAIRVGPEGANLAGDLEVNFPKAKLVADEAGLNSQLKRVVRSIESPGKALGLPLDLRGTDFQQRVWAAVREIPAGQTRTYAEIAQQIGAPKAMRAVGSACAANPLAGVIPCHRVTRRDGGPSNGAYWGEERRKLLIEREAQTAARRRGKKR